jgi:hypothetical protein
MTATDKPRTESGSIWDQRGHTTRQYLDPYKHLSPNNGVDMLKLLNLSFDRPYMHSIHTLNIWLDGITDDVFAVYRDSQYIWKVVIYKVSLHTKLCDRIGTPSPKRRVRVFCDFTYLSLMRSPGTMRILLMHCTASFKTQIQKVLGCATAYTTSQIILVFRIAEALLYLD